MSYNRRPDSTIRTRTHPFTRSSPKFHARLQPSTPLRHNPFLFSLQLPFAITHSSSAFDSTSLQPSTPSELRSAGVFVKTVEDKPQAADWAVKRQMQHSMSLGVDWLFLVSDDSEFSNMLRRVREANMGTVVIRDMDRALGRHADVWVPWIQVENGEVAETDLVPKNQRRREDDLFSVSGFDVNLDDESDLMDNVVDELVAARTEINGVRMGNR